MANRERFIKIIDKERELLFKTNSVVAYEVYFHLKGDDSYYNGEFYDLRRCIAEYLNIPERTVKDALKRLKDVGLVETTKRGKVNIYTLPYNRKNIKTDDRERNNDFQDTSEEVKEQLNRETEQEIIEEDGGFEQEFRAEEYIKEHLNRVLVPYLERKGAQYYQEMAMLAQETSKIYKEISIIEAQSMIEDLVRINSRVAS